ncbi:hypothetical protein ACIPJS_39295 [Streptomyces sp. NPDC086783]|uniref:hypothetical protein n=1 Tax=Streptomyces sp. NPDC086783 TaxID=3365758 RepID=UPI00381C1E69
MPALALNVAAAGRIAVHTGTLTTSSPVRSATLVIPRPASSGTSRSQVCSSEQVRTVPRVTAARPPPLIQEAHRPPAPAPAPAEVAAPIAVAVPAAVALPAVVALPAAVAAPAEVAAPIAVAVPAAVAAPIAVAVPAVVAAPLAAVIGAACAT